MVGKKTFGALGVFSFWSQLALAQAPVDSSAPAPEVPPVPNPATEAAPAPPVSAPPSAEAVPPQAAPSPPAAETEAPTATPRVRWKDTDATQAAPQEGSEEAPDESTPPPPPEGDAWQLGGAHFVLSLERLTTVLAWKQTTTLSTPSGGGFNSPATTSDATTSGTDISFLFGGGERTPSSLPRIAFDGIFNGGFTIGGSVGLMSSTAKSESNAFRGESAQADLTGALFGVRAGYFGVAGSVGIWLRGGFTYLTASAEGETSSTGSAPTVTTRTTVSAWAFTLDPQLVLVPAPRIGITLGPLLDIPVAGTDKTVTNGQTEELEYRSSAYGITAGVAALF